MENLCLTTNVWEKQRQQKLSASLGIHQAHKCSCILCQRYLLKANGDVTVCFISQK